MQEAGGRSGAVQHSWGPGRGVPLSCPRAVGGPLRSAAVRLLPVGSRPSCL